MPNSSWRISGLLMLLAAAVLWSSINVILKHLALRDLNPVVVSCALYLSAVSALVPVSFVLWVRSGQDRRAFWRLQRPSLTVGAAKAAEALCFISAVSFISATQTTLLTKLNSVWTYLILLLFFRSEARATGLAGALLSFLGVYLLLGGRGEIDSLSPDVTTGSALAVLSGLAFAVFSVALEKDPSGRASGGLAHRFRFTSIFLGTALLFMLPFGIALLPQNLPAPSDLGWIYLAGGVFTGATYLLYYSALTRVSSLLAVVLLSSTVLFTMGLEWLFLDISVLTPSFAAGGTLIICGVVVTMKGRERKAGTK